MWYTQFNCKSIIVLLILLLCYLFACNLLEIAKGQIEMLYIREHKDLHLN